MRKQKTRKKELAMHNTNNGLLWASTDEDFPLGLHEYGTRTF